MRRSGFKSKSYMEPLFNFPELTSYSRSVERINFLSRKEIRATSADPTTRTRRALDREVEAIDARNLTVSRRGRRQRRPDTSRTLA